ncbi:MAG: YaiI/YqxD family protein [Coriobacteriia bacterium]|nr:YaiI/YqxD family protein [Coriobacteriia bacterium]
MTTLFIDADACPVTREAITLARSRGIPVLIVANSTQSTERYTRARGVEALQVSVGSDSADFAIIERLERGDVVVTQDIGLAAMVLGRGARAISPRGRVFHLESIDAELAVRHAEARLRRAGGRHRGPTPFEEEDRERFTWALERLLGE